MATIKIRDFECRYEFSGNPESTETIVFINGIAGALEAWSAVTPMFMERFRVLTYDCRGQWFSEVTPSPYSFHQQAEDLHALMDALGVYEAHIVGTSLGGEIAMWFSIMFPTRVKTLSVVASVSQLDPMLTSMVERWQRSALRALDALSQTDSEEVRRRVSVEFYEDMAPELFSREFMQRRPEIVMARKETFGSVCHRGFFDGFIRLCDMFFGLAQEERLTGQIGYIQAPTLVISADNDIIKPPQFGQHIADEIPGAYFQVFNDCAHAVMLEKPMQLAQSLYGFMQANVLDRFEFHGRIANGCA